MANDLTDKPPEGQRVKLEVDDVLLWGTDLMAAPMEKDGQPLFEPTQWKGFYVPIPDVWAEIAQEVGRREDAERLARWKRGVEARRRLHEERKTNNEFITGEETINYNMALRRSNEGHCPSQDYLEELLLAKQPHPLPRNEPGRLCGFDWPRQAKRCAVCGVSMFSNFYRNEAKVCSSRCERKLEELRAERKRDYQRELMRERRAKMAPKDRTRQCEECGDTFEPKRDDAKYCAARCRKRAAYRRKV